MLALQRDILTFNRLCHSIFIWF